MIGLDKDMFDKYSIKITAIQAKLFLAYIEQIDYSDKTIGEVMALNALQIQLQEVVESEDII